VQGPQGETLGKVTQVLKDQKTGDIEYVVLMPNDSKTALPLRWSQFQQKNNDQLQLNMKKEDLKTALNTTSAKDMSPDLAMFMDEIEQKRNEPKGAGGGNEAKAGDPGTLSGAATMGEDATGTHRSAHATPAPGFEHDADKAKKK